jgi:uncharacterized protein
MSLRFSSLPALRGESGGHATAGTPSARVGRCLVAGAATVVLLLSTACSPAGESGEESGQGGELSIATGGTGGVYYPLGGGLATVIRQNVQGYDATVQETNASIDNMLLVQGDSADLALGVGDVVADAVEGVREFDGRAVDLCSLGNLYNNYMQPVTTAGTGITSVEDMRGKTVSIGDPGSATELGAMRILEAAGLDPEQDVELRQLGVDETVTALKDGTIDAGFWSGGLPTSALVDLATSEQMVLIPNGQYSADLQRQFGEYYMALDVPANTYEDQQQPVSVIASPNILVASPEMDEQLQEDVTSAIFENKQQLVKVHPAAKEFDPARASEVPFIETCPGAQRYFDQAGG